MEHRIQKVTGENEASMDRRDFMVKGGLAAAALSAGLFVNPVRSKAAGANDKLGIGLFGAGWRQDGILAVLNYLKQNDVAIEVTAVCDIYKPRAKRLAALAGDAKIYFDSRQLLADPGVDVVFIATPDHQHAQNAIDAINAGKHVYCEKPMTHWDQTELARKLCDTVSASDRVFQLGTQAMSDGVWAQMKTLVKDGLIGKPIYGEAGLFRIGDFGEKGMPLDNGIEGWQNAKPGTDLDWEAFLGDRPKREFDVNRYFRWRMFLDYAGGPVTDLYPHSLTQVIDIMGLDIPDSVVGLGAINRYNDPMREVPDTFSLIAQYPDNVSLAVLGTQGNDFETTASRGSGIRTPVIRGWDGALYIDRDNKEIVFEPIRQQGAKAPQRFVIKSREDMTLYVKDFLDKCRAGDKTTYTPVDLAFRTQTVLQMAMLSHMKGKTAKYDKASRKVIV
jgi:predicted dehydrogenase